MRAMMACGKLGAWLAVIGPAAVAGLASSILLAGCGPAYMDAAEPMAAARPQPKKRPQLALPDPALLRPQAAPNCEDGGQPQAEAKKASEPSAEATRRVVSTDAALPGAAGVAPQSSGGGEPARLDADMAVRIKLEYERECYRQAEARVRDRLKHLQLSVTDSLKFYKRLEAEYR
jgi:hypothetical protein